MTPPIRPLFSIITATYNAQSSIHGLLSSLARQSCRDFELLIQDGGSTDTTLDIIANTAQQLPQIRVHSESDIGIYDAWNKAIQHATGQWFLFLGADDRLSESNTLHNAAGILHQLTQGKKFAAGSVNMINNYGMLSLRSTPNFDGKTRERLSFIAPVAFPGLFIRRSVALNFPFDTSLRISADYDFLCRTWDEMNAVALPFEIAIMLEGGISSIPENQFFAALENAKVASRHFAGVWNFVRLKMLTKAALVSGAFRLLGQSRGATVLDTIRHMRGLPPCWKR